MFPPFYSHYQGNHKENQKMHQSKLKCFKKKKFAYHYLFRARFLFFFLGRKKYTFKYDQYYNTQSPKRFTTPKKLANILLGLSLNNYVWFRLWIARVHLHRWKYCNFFTKRKLKWQWSFLYLTTGFLCW